MNPDGVSYLDLATYAVAGEWRHVVNAFWSPLYPGLLAVALAVVRPEPAAIFPLVHAVNFLVFLGALFCFERFLDELLIKVRDRVNILVAFGYTLFGWATLRMIGLEVVTPDLLVATFTIATVTVVLRIGREPVGCRKFLLLGVLLGLGYLAKAPMLVFGIVSLVVCGWLYRRVALAACMFVLIAGSWVLAISLAKGRPTIGDSARLNYAMFVNRVQYGVHWQDAQGAVHPTRKIGDNPALYEFAQPIGGSYPAWFDPSYWYEGVPVQINLRAQLWTLWFTGSALIETIGDQWPLVIGILVLAGLGIAQQSGAGVWLWPVIILAAVQPLLHLLVHIEMRYWAASNMLLWLGVLAGLRLPDRRVVNITTTVTLGILWAMLLTGLVRSPKADDLPVRVAAELRQIGIGAGAAVGHIGYSFHAAEWAYLARVKIIAELPTRDPDEFTNLDAARQADLMQRFGNCGVRAVIRWLPVGTMSGWQRLGETPYLIYLFPARAENNP
ncbi:MAG: hypothetical protein WCS70_08820 [Verrucomicrobiota bacterium]